MYVNINVSPEYPTVYITTSYKDNITSQRASQTVKPTVLNHYQCHTYFSS